MTVVHINPKRARARDHAREQLRADVQAGFGGAVRFGAFELRGAGRYSQDNWPPSVGAGFDLTRNFGIDAALFGTQTFLESSPTGVGHFPSLRQDVNDSCVTKR